jgi:hypothetical protein
LTERPQLSESTASFGNELEQALSFGCGDSEPAEKRKEIGVEQRYAITVKFLVDADSAEDAEEMVETACEKASASFPEMNYEGIEDIEEEEE